MRETPKASAAYAEYAAMGPTRSLAKLFEQLRQTNPKSPPIETLKAWSAAHGWQERVKDHDAAIIADKEAQRLAAIERMNERHALLGTSQQKRALEQLEALADLNKLGDRALVALLKLAVDVERTARGAPTSVERHEQTGADGGPIQHELTNTYANVLDAKLDRIAASIGSASDPDRTTKPVTG